MHHTQFVSRTRCYFFRLADSFFMTNYRHQPNRIAATQHLENVIFSLHGTNSFGAERLSQVQEVVKRNNRRTNMGVPPISDRCRNTAS